MTYKATLNWLFAQLPMYQKKGAVAYKGKLDNIRAFCDHLENPQGRFKSIHVAGTNGKGSSCHMLASILQQAGYKTGLYTSPHLKDFRERIRVNGKAISKEEVIGFVENNRQFFEYHEMSFFEMTVGMAFDYFARQEVDIAVIEVGLGGRLDSTNIIIPEVSLITNIGYDHMDILGNTLEKIAMEKAGIIKRGIPVVISERQPETEMIFTLLANQRQAALTFAEDLELQEYLTDLKGNYQSKNIKGVIGTLRHLKGFTIEEDHIVLGLKNVVPTTGILGRWQKLQERPLVICDTAHNEEGLQEVLQQLGQLTYGKLHLVLGFAKDKQVEALLLLFPQDARYYFVKPDVPRGLDQTVLKQLAKNMGLKGKAYGSVQKGFKKALAKAKPNDLIYVGGSTFVVAEVV